MGVDSTCIAPPDVKTVNAYHSTLMAMPEVALRAGDYKPVERDIAETSVRSVMADISGMLYVSALIDDNIPTELQFKPDGAGEGLLLARDLLAKAFDVSVDHVHFLPRGLRMNMDDMGGMYSSQHGFSMEEKGLVLKDHLNSSYGSHRAQTSFDGKKFSGIKFKFTNGLVDSGHMAPIFMQIPGLSNEEMPPEKSKTGVEIIEVEGMAADGRVNLNSSSVGYVAFIRKETGCEVELFKKYNELCRQPTVDAARRRLGLDPADPHARFVSTVDGGIPQLTAAINSKESFAQKEERNEVHVKLSKNRTAVFQPCDAGDGHSGTRFQTKKLSREPMPALSAAPSFDKGYHQKRNEGRLNLPAHKVQEARATVSRAADVHRIVYYEKGNLRSFVIPGWLDSKTLQGPDVLVMLKTLKRKYSAEEKNKWISDLPIFIQEMREFGHIREATFDRLGYPVDQDRHGTEHLLPDNLVARPHRQRLLIVTHEYLRSQFLESIAKSKEGTNNASEQEMIERQNILTANLEAEGELHKMADREVDSCRSEFVDCPPSLKQLHKLKGKWLKPFLRARLCTDSKGKVPTTVGKPENVQPVLDKLDDNQDYPVTPKEDSLLLRAYLNRSVVELTLKVEDVCADAADCEIDCPCSMFDNDDLLEEVVTCVANLDELIVSVTAAQRDLRNDLVRMIRPRLAAFKRNTLKSMPQLCNHWTIAAFEDNIVRISELVVLLELVSTNVGAVGFGKSLLRAMSSECNISAADDDVSSMQGVAVVRDKQRGVFVNVVKAGGTSQDFKSVLSKLEGASRNPAAGNKFATGYPHKRPSKMMRGFTKGTYSDLEVLIAIAIDPSNNNDCLTRLSKGLLRWNKGALNKIESSTTEGKMMKLVLSMFTLFLNLMLDSQDSLSQGNFFEEFMHDYNLLTKSRS